MPQDKLAKLRKEELSQLFLSQSEQLAQLKADYTALALKAETKARLARSYELAAHSQLVRDKYPQRGLLLALEALRAVTGMEHTPSA